jgi:hypothetical protein
VIRQRDREAMLLGQLTGDRGPAPGIISSRRDTKTDRRLRPVWSFIYGCFHPRRRDHRRDKDTHRLHVDWHDSSLLWLSLGIVLMSCADALFTLNLLAVGGQELNLFMKHLIEQDVNRFLFLKIGLTGIGVIMLVAASRYRLLGTLAVKRVLQLLCAAYAVLISHELILLAPFVRNSGILDDMAQGLSGLLS